MIICKWTKFVEPTFIIIIFQFRLQQSARTVRRSIKHFATHLWTDLPFGPFERTLFKAILWIDHDHCERSLCPHPIRWFAFEIIFFSILNSTYGFCFSNRYQKWISHSIDQHNCCHAMLHTSRGPGECRTHWEDNFPQERQFGVFAEMRKSIAQVKPRGNHSLPI